MEKGEENFAVKYFCGPVCLPISSSMERMSSMFMFLRWPQLFLRYNIILNTVPEAGSSP